MTPRVQPGQPSHLQYIAGFFGAFVGIAAIALIGRSWMDGVERLFLIGSFGATSVLVYGAPGSPFSAPRNVIWGHVISAMIGVSIAALPLPAWIESALAVALSILVMQLTRTVHPPGGATALIATLDSPVVTQLGFGYVVHPVGIGASVLVLIAMLSNRLAGVAYPTRFNALLRSAPPR